MAYFEEEQIHSVTVKCIACFNDYSEKTELVPRILHCGHTTCTGCTENLYDDGQIACPKCKELTKVARPADLPQNYDLRAMLYQLTMLKESKERVLPLLELDDSNEHVKEAGMEKIKSITIAVKDQESVLVEYCINVNMKMSQLLSKHAEKTGVDVRTIAFLLDHRTVQPEDTPDSLEMKEGDIISAHRLSQSE